MVPQIFKIMLQPTLKLMRTALFI